jgi:hypothetical protein
VLLETSPATGLGRALAWAQHREHDELDVLVTGDAGVVARRAAQFSTPPRVWEVVERSVTPATPAAAHQPANPSPDALELVDLLAGSGADIVIEHGVVMGEVAGLEVARIVSGADGAHVEVGVGRHDREAFALVHGDVPTADALASVVESVRSHRRSGGPMHPLARLAAERWLRASLVADPGSVGVRALEPVEPTIARASVKDVTAAVAVGVDRDGGPVVVACSVGIDLDLVPAAADARLSYAPGARLLLVLPARDAHPVTRRLGEALRDPAEVVELTADWRA